MRIGSAGWLLVGGTLSGLLGCGDPLPPPARLAVNLELASCGVDGLYTLPDEDALVKTTLQPSIPQSQLDSLPRIVEGEGGASVSCNVTESSPNNFTFSASGAIGATRSFTLDGVTTGPSGAGKGAGTATVSFSNPNTLPRRTGSNCVITTELAPAGGGALLLSFNCSPPASTFQGDSIDASATCSASGTVVIDRCSK